MSGLRRERGALAPPGIAEEEGSLLSGAVRAGARCFLDRQGSRAGSVAAHCVTQGAQREGEASAGKVDGQKRE